ncbi:aromatic ring-hydroxylating dioxygenase subunit alpha [Okeania sp. SIO3B5]|uniref:aromatic ring-hydroxylating oxygenase subunit alpha n=1 Tax=Okeania sp. SIO3B5 TaxID=2607811 RepID=UPI0025CED782|nr:aromatic ring-hydroxylating dioxygenase subunit alpha [Okeania sp. SIO3B5]
MNTNKTMPVLPIEAYTSQEWFNKEQKYIFSNTWQFAGFIEDLNEPGDYLTVQAGLNNILVIYGEDQQLKAFHNVCRHRGTQLLRAVGKSKKFITCPYHDWTYTLDGELSAVPERKTQFPDLDMSLLCLHKASVGVWRGMIFVHPDANAESLSNWFGGIEPYLGAHQPEKLVEYEGARTRHEINANWKIVVENYIDGYHLAHLHSETLFMYDHRKQQTGFVGNHFYFYEPLAKDYGADIQNNSPYPLIDHIPPEKIGAYVPMLFPNLGLSETESTWSIFHIIPIAPDKCVVEIRSKIMPVSSWDFAAQEWKSWNYFKSRQGDKYKTKDKNDPMASGDFMAEDIYVCEQQQKSLQSPYFSVGAIAKDLEKSVYQYQRNVQNYIEKQS